MKDNNYVGAIEAILFASGEPLEIERLARGLSIEIPAAREQLELYRKKLEKEERGLQLLFLGESVQLCVKEEHEELIVAIASMRKNAPLSNASMEVLAIIAYNQPVTKSFIEQVRGVESGQVVNNLVEKGLVEEAGRLNVPGRPISYKTTLNFLRSFGMSGLEDLPALPDRQKAEEPEQMLLVETEP